MSLRSGKKITRRSWDVIPMSDAVIEWVNKLGASQPEDMVFTDRKGRLMGDVELTGVDGEIEPLQNEFNEPIDEDEASEASGIDLKIDPEAQEPHEAEADYDYEQEQDIEVETVAEESNEPIPEPPRVTPEVEIAPPVVVTPPAEDPLPRVEQEIPGVRRSSGVRTQTKPGYVPSFKGNKHKLAATQMEKERVLHPDAHLMFQHEPHQAEPDVVAAIMMQLSLKAGLKRWGKTAKAAVFQEMKQLHLRDTHKTLHWCELTADQKKTVLESHVFLKLKRLGKIKARKVAGGNKQRDFLSKEEVSSPMVLSLIHI